MALGYIDKDFIEEGPFRCVFYDIEMDDPAALSNVKLWMARPDGSRTFFVADGLQKSLSDGEVVYEFNGNTKSARKLLDDGKLETKTVEVGDGDTEQQPVTRSLEPDRKYIAEVTFELDVITLRAVGARAEVLVRRSYSL